MRSQSIGEELEEIFSGISFEGDVKFMEPMMQHTSLRIGKGIDSTDKGKGRINHTILKKYRDLHRPFKLRLLRIVETVESAAFKQGMRFASGLVGGSCILCKRCVDDKSSQSCRCPFRARPPMEAVGIDVIKTASNAGLPISLSSSSNVLWTGLVLLE